MNVVLYQPEIPQNTGNIIRICANTGAKLHLVKPFGFEWDDKRLRRAGLDYHELALVTLHEDFEACQIALADTRWFALTTKAKRSYAEITYRPNDTVLFGQETKGLPAYIAHRLKDEQKLRIPMQATSRSINLANSVAITLYEGWRQQNFDGLL
ncbi:MAG: tRNA (uridine(34)/cytosine(34)/5-carboxymethylaminomethyluridine(34)-2'-O)-methyltransferase TrmL [Pseudomonadales bacterium]|jgi:tRNA (cytidine/uridine-2'-O-)-methyltransferase|nr:tRNA (uridine(34)/cytosine(34)/5-carboxymethylaminomethyluridine(34)-2'-O)-methyltransferase TrmL [Pseudomonadales bacterium]